MSRASPATEEVQAAAYIEAFASHPDIALLTLSGDGRVTTWSVGAERLFGLDAAQILGRPVRQLVPPGCFDLVAGDLRRVNEGETVRLHDARAVYRDGTLRDVSIAIAPIRDASGRVAGASVMLHDNSARLRLEQAWRDSERRFRSTLDSIMEGCQLLSFDWRYLYLNDAAASQNRRPNSELIGRTMTECWPGIEHTAVYAMLRRTMDQRVALQSEVEFAFPDGSVGYFEVRGQPVPEGLFILSIDISARHRHEVQLEQHSRLYHALSEINQLLLRRPGREALLAAACRNLVEFGGFAMTWIGWEDGESQRVLPVASAASDGVEPPRIEVRLDDTPQGRGPAARALREAQACVCNDVLAAASTQPWRSEYERRGLRSSAAFPIIVDGRAVGVLSVYASQTDRFQEREVSVLQQVAKDIGTALELAERQQERAAALDQARAERRFSDAMIESLPGVAYFYDEAGRFLRWNRNFLTVTGYDEAALATMQPADFFLGEDRANVERAIAATFATGQSQVQAGFVSRDGTVTPYFFTGRRLLLDGRPYLVGVGIDVSARDAAEAEVRRLNAELEQRIRERTEQLEAANRDLESFSYSVSHDLRAPLRAINGFCDILMEDYAPQLPADAQGLLQRIRDAGRRMGHLIDDLLNLSRLGRTPLKTGPVDMTALARRAVQEQEAQCRGRRISFDIAELPPCQGDASLLLQVWINLVSNAVKYSRGRDPARVEIGCELRDGLPIYWIRDNGTGFDMRYAGKLFGVFQRLHGNAEFEGTGVGLAIVRRVLARHGGRIWAEAAVDQGAKFFFTVRADERP